MTDKNFAKQDKNPKRNSKFVKRTLDLLLVYATSEKDFHVAEHTIKEYLNQGYNVEDYLTKHKRMYDSWKRIQGN